MVNPLVIQDIGINSDCVGRRWETSDVGALARLIAIVALGQATKAALILKGLSGPHPESYTNDDLLAEAISTLTASEEAAAGEKSYPRVQRDGFLFEVVSWIAAVHETGENGALKDPHIRSTSQGMDGLYLELNPDRTSLTRSTVFEDKCSTDPTHTFAYKVIPSFKERHANRRNAELVTTASTLLMTIGLSPADASRMSGEVLLPEIRHYRAALAIAISMDNATNVAAIFKKYSDIDNLSPQQRIGCVFIAGEEIRGWFRQLAHLAINYLEDQKSGRQDV